jgi:hypothetical protein
LVDSIRVIRVLFTRPLRWGSALCGMALFWAADALATEMLFTRRMKRERAVNTPRVSRP